MDLALRRARWQRPWGQGGNTRPWSHRHPRHHIPFGVHTLDIGSVILDLESPRGSGVLWSVPELLPRLGPALALLPLEHVHGLADCWEHERVRSRRDDGTSAEYPQHQQECPPTPTHRCSPRGSVVCAQAHQTTAPPHSRHPRRYDSRHRTPAAAHLPGSTHASTINSHKVHSSVPLSS